MNSFLRLVVLLSGLFLSAPAWSQSCDLDALGSSGFETRPAVTVAGFVAAIPEALVEVRSGASVLASATTENGAFDIEVPPGAGESVLELRAFGLAENGQDFVELAAWLGPRDGLLDAVGPSGSVGVGSVPGLAVSPLSTARYVLVGEAGGPGVNACQLDASVAALAESDVLERAAVIKLLIDNGGAYAPAAAGAKGPVLTTLGAIADPVQLQEQIDAIELDSPGALTAMAGLLGEDFCAYFSPEALFVAPSRADGSILNTFSGDVFALVDATRGEHSQSFGKDGFDYSCAGDLFVAQLDGNRVSVGYPFREVNGQTRQVTMENRVVEIRLLRVDSSINEVTVASTYLGESTFPFDPLPAEPYVGEGELALVREPRAAPFTPGQFAGKTWAVPSRQVNDSSQQLSIDLISFDASTADATDVLGGGALAWSINAEGELVLDFDDRSARIIPLRDDAGAIDTLAVIDFDDGRRVVSGDHAVEQRVVSDWVDPSLVPGVYQQHAFRATGGFEFRLGADRSAPAFNFIDDQPVPSFATAWSRPDQDSVVLRRCIQFNGSTYTEPTVVDREPNPGECNDFYRRREWTLLNSAPNPDGAGRYLWLMEDNQDYYGDPTTLPGPGYRFFRTILYLKQDQVTKQLSPALSAGGRAAAAARDGRSN